MLGNRIKSWEEHVQKTDTFHCKFWPTWENTTWSEIWLLLPQVTLSQCNHCTFSFFIDLCWPSKHFLWEMYTIHICKHTKIIVNSHETVGRGDITIQKGAAHASTSISVFSNSTRVPLSGQKGLDLIFYEDVQEEQENIKVEGEEIPEDKDDERYVPEHSESSSDNADTPEDHRGEKGTFLSKNEKITWSSSHCGTQGWMMAHGEIQDDLLDWQFPMVRTLSQCLIYSAQQCRGKPTQVMRAECWYTSTWPVFWTKTPHGVDCEQHPTSASCITRAVILIISSMAHRPDKSNFLLSPNLLQWAASCLKQLNSAHFPCRGMTQYRRKSTLSS